MTENITWGRPEYDIWKDDSPAATALRENLPYMLTDDELAKKPLGPLPQAPVFTPDKAVSYDIQPMHDGIARMISDAATNRYHQDQAGQRMARHLAKIALPQTAFTPLPVQDAASNAAASFAPATGPASASQEKAPDVSDMANARSFVKVADRDVSLRETSAPTPAEKPAPVPAIQPIQPVTPITSPVVRQPRTEVTQARVTAPKPKPRPNQQPTQAPASTGEAATTQTDQIAAALGNGDTDGASNGSSIYALFNALTGNGPKTDSTATSASDQTSTQARIAAQDRTQVRRTAKTNAETAGNSAFQQAQEAVAATRILDVADAYAPAIASLKKQMTDAAQNKVPVVLSPEQDMVDIVGAARKSVVKIYDNSYDNAAKSIGQADTLNAEETMKGGGYTQTDYIDAINANDHANTFGARTTMEKTDPDAVKGFSNSLRGLRLDFKKIQALGDNFFNYREQYFPHRQESLAWIAEEERYLAANKVPELVDFTRLNWRENPDQVIELGGQYFRHSLLGTHFFNYAVDTIKGTAGPIANQIVGTLSGIASFYAQSDDLVASALRGTAGSSVESWDFLVGQLSKKLPLLSRQGLLFLNNVLSREAKAKMFEAMMKGMKEGKGRAKDLRNR